MIEVRNLCKYFKRKNAPTVRALDDVSFKLPNKGFVFVIGKSGSGKTTLLSLIGGLDNITKGEILVDGKSFKSFSHSDFDNYRNNYTGFIFQDYHLLEDLTIYDNIKMMLDFKHDKDVSKITKALHEVGLDGYESRYPRELSGGEKQRVAIARVIVKDPEVILADEPTGNLDRETTKQILSILKNISKSKLVLIVSHNQYDAFECADRVINLSEGKKIGEYIYNYNVDNKLHYENGVIYIPKHKLITLDDKNKLLKEIEGNEVKDIEQIKLSFLPYDESEAKFENLNVNISKKHIAFIDNIKYGFKFYKNKFVKSFIFSAVCAIVFTVLCVIFDIFTINSKSMMRSYLKDIDLEDISLVKNYQSSDGYIKHNFLQSSDYFVDSDLVEINKYCDKYYLSYMLVSTSYRFCPFSKNCPNLKEVVSVDDDFLNYLFGIDDNVQFVKRREQDIKGGFYITDFYADEIINTYSSKNYIITYDTLLTQGFRVQGCNYCFNGIIITNYKEEFKSLLQYFDTYNNAEEDYLDLKGDIDSLEFYKMLDKVNNIYINAYSYSDTPLEDYYSSIQEQPSNEFKLIVNDSNLNYGIQGKVSQSERYEDYIGHLNNDEMIISTEDLNLLFPNIKTKFGFNFLDEPIEIDLSAYNNNDLNLENPYYKNKIKIIGYINGGANYVNKDTFLKVFNPYFTKPTKVFLVNPADALYIQDNLCNDKISLSLYEAQTFVASERYTDVLVNFFKFIFIILLIVIALGIIFYVAKVIKNNIFEIGVMKSLGARDKDIILQMGINILITSLMLICIYDVLEIIFVRRINNLLVNSINSVILYISCFYPGYKIIAVTPMFLIITDILIVSAMFISVVIPFIKLRRLKPTNIIKAKE